MALRRLVFALAALLLLGLVASPAAARAQSDPIQPAAFVDTDEDGLSDADEADYGTDPAVYDTDGDGFGDNQEVVTGSDPLDENSVPANGQPGVDTDGDLLSDAEEAEIGTDPTKLDTDGDELSDFAEVGFEPGSSTGTDPLKFDTDGDGLGDGAELRQDGWGTDPTNADTDGDGYNDGEELYLYDTDPKDPASVPDRSPATLIVEARILPAGYTGNDFIGDSQPLSDVHIRAMMPGSDMAFGGVTDGNGSVVVPGLIPSNYSVTLEVPGDFANFLTFFGTADGVEPRQHENQNTNAPVVYIGPGETLYGTFYVIPVDAKGDENPAPAPQPQTPSQNPTTVVALPNTGTGLSDSSTGLTIPAVLIAAGSVFALAAFGAFRQATHKG